MRVLYVIDSLAPGGAERSLAEMAPVLVRSGVDLHVLPLLDRDGVADDLRAGGAQVHPAVGATRVAALPAVVGAIRTLRPELVHTTLFEADVVGRVASALTRTPVVSTLANMPLDPAAGDGPGSWRVRGALVADRATCRRVRRFHAVSHAVADAAPSRLGIPRGRIEVVHRGRDLARLGRRTPHRRRAARAGLGIDVATPVVVAVARHEPQKGLDVLVEAWPAVCRANPLARLLVAGRHGTSTAALEDRADALRINASVSWLGRRDDVADLLVAADVFVLPSRHEGLPGALVEALALECPAVASDIAPVREVVGQPACAQLVAVGDHARLTDAIVAALDRGANPGATACGRRRVETMFDVDVAAARIAAFYRKAAT